MFPHTFWKTTTSQESPLLKCDEPSFGDDEDENGRALIGDHGSDDIREQREEADRMVYPSNEKEFHEEYYGYLSNSKIDYDQ